MRLAAVVGLTETDGNRHDLPDLLGFSQPGGDLATDFAKYGQTILLGDVITHQDLAIADAAIFGVRDIALGQH